MSTFQTRYEALLRKDPTYEGSFIVGVKTTGIFCRPTCTARKPLPENVLFFDTCREALQHGFRPCKVCRPLEKAGAMPADIRELVREVQADPLVRVRDSDLRKRGLEPSRVRRWFKQAHGMTFQAYQRMLRINLAYRQISQGEKVTAAAFDSGYESLSGFHESFRSVFGEPPKKAANRRVIHLMRLTTPLGPMVAGATDRGVCLLEFTDRRMLETEFKELSRLLGAVILPGGNDHLRLLQSELQEYFDGRRHSFSVPLDAPGTDFQTRVWKALQEIPFGQTISYRQLAERLGKPRAVRAVGAANGHNRIAIVIPCHRVIGADGSLTGYGGGLERKQWLLRLEQGRKG